MANVLSYGFEVRDRLLAAETSPRSAPDKRRVMSEERCNLLTAIQAYQRDNIDREQLQRSIEEAVRVMGLWSNVDQVK